MTSKDKKPDFSGVTGSFKSDDKAAPKASKPDFSQVKGGFQSADVVAEGAGAGAGSAAGGDQARTYTVKSGDSLSKIAKRELGNAKHWPLIFQANRDQLENPDLIHPGQVLKIPALPAGEDK